MPAFRYVLRRRIELFDVERRSRSDRRRRSARRPATHQATHGLSVCAAAISTSSPAASSYSLAEQEHRQRRFAQLVGQLHRCDPAARGSCAPTARRPAPCARLAMSGAGIGWIQEHRRAVIPHPLQQADQLADEPAEAGLELRAAGDERVRRRRRTGCRSARGTATSARCRRSAESGSGARTARWRTRRGETRRAWPAMRLRKRPALLVHAVGRADVGRRGQQQEDRRRSARCRESRRRNRARRAAGRRRSRSRAWSRDAV